MGEYGHSDQGFVNVAETAQWPGGSDNLSLYDNGGTVAYAELGIDPNTMGPILIVNDILVDGVNGEAVVSRVTNQFSEAAPVPEPSTMLLLGSGLLGLWGARKKFKK